MLKNSQPGTVLCLSQPVPGSEFLSIIRLRPRPKPRSRHPGSAIFGSCSDHAGSGQMTSEIMPEHMVGVDDCCEFGCVWVCIIVNICVFDFPK